jgi:hypothetical protein
LGFSEIEKEFVLIRAFAVFHNRFELPPCFLYRARASEPYNQIANYLFQLNFHFSPLSHTSPQTLRGDCVTCNLQAMKSDIEGGKTRLSCLWRDWQGMARA